MEKVHKNKDCIKSGQVIKNLEQKDLHYPSRPNPQKIKSELQVHQRLAWVTLFCIFMILHTTDFSCHHRQTDAHITQSKTFCNYIDTDKFLKTLNATGHINFLTFKSLF